MLVICVRARVPSTRPALSSRSPPLLTWRRRRRRRRSPGVTSLLAVPPIPHLHFLWVHVCVWVSVSVCVCAEHFTRAARRTHLKPREVIRRAALTFSPLFFLLNIEQVQLEKSRRARLWGRCVCLCVCVCVWELVCVCVFVSLNKSSAF